MAQKKSARGTRLSDSYEKAVVEYAKAMDQLHKDDFAGAKKMFEAVEAANPDEPTLGERSRTYARHCEAKMADAAPDPRTPDERYLRAVFLSNAGDYDAALELLNLSLRENPASAKYFYARASAYALKGSTEQAVDDLRQAIAIDPTTRFQAVNDTDFEGIREEPAFIDIIEPTPAGA